MNTTIFCNKQYPDDDMDMSKGLGNKYICINSKNVLSILTSSRRLEQLKNVSKLTACQHLNTTRLFFDVNI